jgi:hypothetical protein
MSGISCFCAICGARLLTREAQQAGRCYECRDPALYEAIRQEPDLEKQFAMLKPKEEPRAKAGL